MSRGGFQSKALSVVTFNTRHKLLMAVAKVSSPTLVTHYDERESVQSAVSKPDEEEEELAQECQEDKEIPAEERAQEDKEVLSADDSVSGALT